MTGSNLVEVKPFFGGQWHDATSEHTVYDKFTDQPATRVGCLDREQTTEAIRVVDAAQNRINWDPVARYDALATASRLLLEHHDDFTRTIVADSGFTVSDAAREVQRAAQTLLLSGEEAKRLAGEVVPLAGAAGQSGRLGFTTYHPRGLICAITPFNSPVNTVVHKIAPALAAGNAVLLKPASQTPRTAARLVQLLLQAGIPDELIGLLYGDGATVGQWLLEDPRPAFYAFTGSTEVGQHLRRTVGLRPTQLEMGSLSSTIICADADVAAAVPRIVNAAFRKAGQVCTSVQRLYIERPILDEVLESITAALSQKKTGDPSLPDTFVGPLISPSETSRVCTWIDEAISAGATLLTGGTHDGNVIHPTVLTDVTHDMAVMNREIFGPAIVVRPFTEIATAITEANDTPYGLAAGVFTKDITKALAVAERLCMGSVHINETSSSRVDLMPYTGTKRSGMGREGPRYAIREMSEERLITFR